MTWTKLGMEFADECAHVDLSDAAFRTHVEAIAYLYKLRHSDCLFGKRALRRFATSDHVADAVKELLDHGFWKRHEDGYEVVHHADVIRDSLAAQEAKRDRDRKAQQRARQKKESASPEREVSDRVSADTRQTDRQTDKHLEGPLQDTCKHGVLNGSMQEVWAEAGSLVCPVCTDEGRRTA